MLHIAADLNMKFGSHLGDLSRILLSEAGDDASDQILLTRFLEQEYTRHESELEHESLSVVSKAFCYLQTVFASAAPDSRTPQKVFKELNDFEMKIAERQQECLQEQERQREQDRQRDQEGEVLESKQELECKLEQIAHELKEIQMKFEDS